MGGLDPAMVQRPMTVRLAPSPTGAMHAGNIFAAAMAWLIARVSGGEVVLRIEDLDRDRSKREYADRVMRDFEALGITWDRGPYYQQGRDGAYEEAFQRLSQAGLVYPCYCTRADLHAASAPHRGEKLVYPGTCRNLDPQAAARFQAQGRTPSHRLRVPGERFDFVDLIQGPFGQDLALECGDFIIRRSDGLFAYQLACVVDDGAQGVNCVVRAMDLLPSTPQQRYLQRLLGLPECTYAHVPLIVGERDRRLSKRDRDASLDEMMVRYGSPEGVLGHIAFVTGLQELDEPVTMEELAREFSLERLGTLFPDKEQILWF